MITEISIADQAFLIILEKGFLMNDDIDFVYLEPAEVANAWCVLSTDKLIITPPKSKMMFLIPDSAKTDCVLTLKYVKLRSHLIAAVE